MYRRDRPREKVENEEPWLVGMFRVARLLFFVIPDVLRPEVNLVRIGRARFRRGKGGREEDRLLDRRNASES